MKKLLLFTVTVLTGLTAASQGCNELFVSEYIEGWSNNKAMELFNPTDDPIDLAGYRLERYSNGATSASDVQKIDLEGTIGAHDVFVVVLEKLDPDGVDFEAPVWEELQEAADLFICPVYDDNNTMYFNGNDAMVLRKIDGNVVVDVVGRIGEDPGNPSDGGGWNNVGPDYTWILNGETAWTANHTLVRKESVSTGDVDPTNPFDVGLEWDSLPANTFEDLGSHLSVCGGTFIKDLGLIDLSLYPNPSNNGIFYLDNAQDIQQYEVYANDGREALLSNNLNNVGRLELDLSNLPSGVYMLRTLHDDGSYGWARLIKH